MSFMLVSCVNTYLVGPSRGPLDPIITGGNWDYQIKQIVTHKKKKMEHYLPSQIERV